jgi:hypothetical protein
MNNELREQILKEALVRSAVHRWSKGPGDIQSSHQAIVEIGIDDLMQVIQSHNEAREQQFSTYNGETIKLCSDCPQFRRNGGWEITQCNNCRDTHPNEHDEETS